MTTLHRIDWPRALVRVYVVLALAWIVVVLASCGATKPAAPPGPLCVEIKVLPALPEGESE